MERRRNPVRRAGLAGLAILALGGLSACGGEGPVGRRPAASVDGHHISRQDVLDVSKGWQQELGPRAAAGDTAAQNGVAEARGDGAGTYGARDAGESVTELVRYWVIVDELAANDIEVTDDDVEAARKELVTQIEGQLTQGGVSEADAKAQVAGMDRQLDLRARRDAATDRFTELISKDFAVEPLTDDEIAARKDVLYQQAVDANLKCVSAAWSVDEDSAQDNLERIEGGEEFATVAAQTINPQSGGPGGDLGCVSSAELGEFTGLDVADAEVGELLGPVDLSARGGGFVLMRVDSTLPPRSELEEQLDAAVAQEQAEAEPDEQEINTAVDARLQELYAEARITVDPRYGTWNPTTGVVEPPVVPGATTTSVAAEPITAVPAGS